MHIRRIVLAAIFGVLATNVVWSQQTPAASDLKAASPATFVLVQIDAKQLAVPDWLGNGQAAVFGKRAVELIRSVSDSSAFYATVDIPNGPAQPLVRLLAPVSNRVETENAKRLLAKVSITEPVVQGGFVVGSPTGEISNRSTGIDEKILPVDRERFAVAASAVSSFPIRILIVPPAHVWETYEELLPELPGKLGGGPTSVVTDGMRWAAIGVNISDGRIAATFQSDDDDAAKAFAKRLPDLLPKLLRQLPEDANLSTIRSAVEAIVKVSQIKVVDDRIQIAIRAGEQQAPREILASLLDNTGGPIAANRKRNRMRQLVLGVLNYESAYACFPPNQKMRGKDGRSGLSWRVHVLPYLEEVELYQRFKLDEPWDSPHNIKLLEEMPDVFSAYSNSGLTDPVLKPGHTTFVAPVGDGTILGGNEVVKIRNVTDGASKTVLIVEVEAYKAVPWTAPQDYSFRPDDPGAGLAWDDKGRVGVAFCDGACRALPKSTSKATLRNLFRMNDGNAINLK